MLPVAVLSHIVIDEVRHVRGGSPSLEVGGAGAYAAVGASLASETDSTILVSGVGRDDRAFLHRWCVDRGIAPSGLFDVSEQSPRTRIQYFEDGEREETPVLGLDHFNAHTPLPRHVPVRAQDLSGIYLFHDHDAGYWDEVHRFRSAASGPLLWEISLDSCRPDAWDAVRDRLQDVDVLSLNTAEAFAIFDTIDINLVTRLLGELPQIVLLRRGAVGSLLLHEDRRFKIGVAPTAALDPTGGGNSYSGAFLSWFARSGNAVEAARVAAASASAVVATAGAPNIDDTTREIVREAALMVSVHSF